MWRLLRSRGGNTLLDVFTDRRPFTKVCVMLWYFVLIHWIIYLFQFLLFCFHILLWNCPHIIHRTWTFFETTFNSRQAWISKLLLKRFLNSKKRSSCMKMIFKLRRKPVTRKKWKGWRKKWKGWRKKWKGWWICWSNYKRKRICSSPTKVKKAFPFMGCILLFYHFLIYLVFCTPTPTSLSILSMVPVKVKQNYTHFFFFITFWFQFSFWPLILLMFYFFPVIFGKMRDELFSTFFILGQLIICNSIANSAHALKDCSCNENNWHRKAIKTMVDCVENIHDWNGVCMNYIMCLCFK